MQKPRWVFLITHHVNDAQSACFVDHGVRGCWSGKHESWRAHHRSRNGEMQWVLAYPLRLWTRTFDLTLIADNNKSITLCRGQKFNTSLSPWRFPNCLFIKKCLQRWGKYMPTGSNGTTVYSLHYNKNHKSQISRMCYYNKDHGPGPEVSGGWLTKLIRIGKTREMVARLKAIWVMMETMTHTMSVMAVDGSVSRTSNCIPTQFDKPDF